MPGLATTLAGYLTLLYTTAAAKVHDLLPKETLTKNYLLAAPRNSMAYLRERLPENVRNFLDEKAQEIQRRFLSFYLRDHSAVLDAVYAYFLEAIACGSALSGRDRPDR